jgi:hypothetical protein
MKVWLELAVKNAQKIKEDVEGKLKNIDLEGIVSKVGGAKAPAAQASGAADIAGMAGNVGKMAGTAVAILGALLIIKGIMDRVWNNLKTSSPYLQGILSVMNRAWMLFWRPFGDFLGALLRPLAIALLKMAVSWIKFTRGEKVKSVTGTIAKTLGLPGSEELEHGIDLKDKIKEIHQRGLENLRAWGDFFRGIHQQGVENFKGWIEKFKGWIDTLKEMHQQGIENIKGWLDFFKDKIEKAKDKLKGFGDWLWGKMKEVWEWTNDFGDWLWEKLQDVWNYGEDFGGWLWDKLKSVWNYTSDFGNWLWLMLQTIWNWVFDLAGWLWDKITIGAESIWEWTYNVGKWLYEKITGSFDNLKNWLGNVGKFLWEKITENLENALSGFVAAWTFSWSWPGYQTGANSVPETGLYRLHKGEQVITAPRADRNTNQSIVLNPTFNITTNGGVNDLDLDSQMRRAARMLEFEVRQRFLI